MLVLFVGRMACLRRLPQVINRVRFNRNVQIFATFRRGTAISPTVLPDHFLFNEPRMFPDVSERINPFPTHTPKGIPFIILPNSK